MTPDQPLGSRPASTEVCAEEAALEERITALRAENRGLFAQTDAARSSPTDTPAKPAHLTGMRIWILSALVVSVAVAAAAAAVVLADAERWLAEERRRRRADHDVYGC